jgi:hypothetical protein
MYFAYHICDKLWSGSQMPGHIESSQLIQLITGMSEVGSTGRRHPRPIFGILGPVLQKVVGRGAQSPSISRGISKSGAILLLSGCGTLGQGVGDPARARPIARSLFRTNSVTTMPTSAGRARPIRCSRSRISSGLPGLCADSPERGRAGLSGSVRIALPGRDLGAQASNFCEAGGDCQCSQARILCNPRGRQ